ncbi:MAG: response regulator [Anaerolineae bacterium]|nr:response regulator [Anaerolineae bacterium]
MSHKPSVLYFEDEPMSRMVMEMLLKRGLGFDDVTIFEDSADFQNRISNLATTPDIVFLDIHIEPYNGFDMLKMLREHPRFERSRIIALTASVMNEEIQMLQDAGFDGGIAKPINQVTFPQLLERILDGDVVWSIV